MQTVAIISHPYNLGESIKIAQRIYKSGHEAINLNLIHVHDQIVHRKPLQWEQSYERMVSLSDGLIIFQGLEEFNTLSAFCMAENIPVFTSFEEWYDTLQP